MLITLYQHLYKKVRGIFDTGEQLFDVMQLFAQHPEQRRTFTGLNVMFIPEVMIFCSKKTKPILHVSEK